MHKMLIAAAILAVSAPAMAQDEAAPAVAQEAAPAATQNAAEQARHGQTLRDAENRRLGEVSHVADDGSVRIIYKSRFVTIPGSTISVVDGKPVTSLTRQEVAKLR